MAEWMNIPGKNGSPPSPLLLSKSRENRGLRHDTCGRLLCPIKFDWDDEVCVQSIVNIVSYCLLGLGCATIFGPVKKATTSRKTIICDVCIATILAIRKKSRTVCS